MLFDRFESKQERGYYTEQHRLCVHVTKLLLKHSRWHAEILLYQLILEIGLFTLVGSHVIVYFQFFTRCCDDDSVDMTWSTEFVVATFDHRNRTKDKPCQFVMKKKNS